MSVIAVGTASEKILLSAFQLEEAGQTPFSAESLIVTSWQNYPETFGLRSFADQHPDSNKVLSSIMGQRGLTKRGWFSKAGQKLYSLTDDGRSVARRLLSLDEEEVQARELSREQEEILNRALESTAADNFEQGRKEELSFVDACRFWDITERLQSDAIDNKMSQLRNVMVEAGRALDLCMGEITFYNGRIFMTADLKLIQETAEYLEWRFTRHLNLLRNRSTRPPGSAPRTEAVIRAHSPH